MGKQFCLRRLANQSASALDITSQPCSYNDLSKDITKMSQPTLKTSTNASVNSATYTFSPRRHMQMAKINPLNTMTKHRPSCPKPWCITFTKPHNSGKSMIHTNPNTDTRITEPTSRARPGLGGMRVALTIVSRDYWRSWPFLDILDLPLLKIMFEHSWLHKHV